MDMYVIFSANCDSTCVETILDIYKYLMKKRYKIMFRFIEKMFIGLLSAITTRNVAESLVLNFKDVSLNNRPC